MTRTILLALLVAAAAPANARDRSGLKSLEKALKRPADAIAHKLKGKVCVLDFSDLGEKGYTSEFGQKVADMLSNQLLGRRQGSYSIMERRELVKILHDSILMVGDDEKAIQDLQKQGRMDVLVSGAYSVAGSEVSIDVKAVDAHTGSLLASATTRVKLAPGLERMVSHRFREDGSAPEPVAAVPGDVLELETGVFFEGGDGKLYPVREGMVLNAKDNYAVYFRAKQDCYVYAYQVDSAQNAFQLFPNKDFGHPVNRVPGNAEVWIPRGSEFLYLDDTKGREEIYIFATRAPAPHLEGIRKGRLSTIQEAIKTMGVAGVRGSETVNRVRATEGSGLELITRKLVAQGDFFYKLGFIHQ